MNRNYSSRSQNVRRKKGRSKWKAAITLLVTMMLVKETTGTAAVYDIAAYNTAACSGDCARNNDMSHIDAAAAVESHRKASLASEFCLGYMVHQYGEARKAPIPH